MACMARELVDAAEKALVVSELNTCLRDTKRCDSQGFSTSPTGVTPPVEPTTPGGTDVYGARS